MSPHDDTADDVHEERFRPTSGRFAGLAAMAVGLAFAALALTDGTRSLPMVFGGLFVAALAWGSSLHPALFVHGRDLVIRNMFVTTRIPLAAIERIDIRQVFVVWVAARKHVSPVVGRTRRRVQRDGDRLVPASTRADELPYAKWVDDRLAELMHAARVEAGIEPESPEQQALAEQVTRTVDRLPVALVAGTGLVFAVSLLF